jgi:hypothetical protein
VIRSTIAAAALTAISLCTIPAAAQARVQVGVLTCRGAETVSYIIASEHRMRCTFRGIRGPRERYVGVIHRFGLDIGINERSVLVWKVFAPTRAFDSGALAGGYGGVTAAASLGIGAGANVLVGGSNRSFALQPLSLEGQRGVNITASITELRLDPR